jgi:hypothetical protein
LALSLRLSETGDLQVVFAPKAVGDNSQELLAKTLAAETVEEKVDAVVGP